MNARKNIVCQSLISLLKDAIFYKNPENPSRIDLILTNNPRSFRNFWVIDASLSDFHRMVVTAMKTSSEGLKRRVINYWDYKSFENKLFREELLFELSNLTLDTTRWFWRVYWNISKIYKSLCPNQIQVCTAQLPFVNKILSKSIMHRTRLSNKYLRNKTDENKRNDAKQRNYRVPLLRKSRIEYYSSQDGYYWQLNVLESSKTFSIR